MQPYRTTRSTRARRRARRPHRIRRALAVVALCAIASYGSNATSEAHAEASSSTGSDVAQLRAELAAARSQLHAARSGLDRWSRIFDYSSRYKVRAELAAHVYDAALAEGIEPDLAFRVVRAESQFDPRALSSAGAVGLTQVLPSTARDVEAGITRERLFDERTNLRIGFRYLRTLVREHRGDVRLALLAYNRGPATVAESRRRGENPSNGYDKLVMKGYRGRGVTD